MEKTAPSTPSKRIDFAPGLSAAASSLNPKKIDPHIYRQVAIFVGLAVLIAVGLFAYLWIGQEMEVRRQIKAKEPQSTTVDGKLEQRQLDFKHDEQRRTAVTTINSNLKSYFLKENKVPAALKELVPGYFAKLPTDPKTKKEYNYTPGADQKSWKVAATLSDGKKFEAKGP